MPKYLIGWRTLGTLAGDVEIEASSEELAIEEFKARRYVDVDMLDVDDVEVETVGVLVEDE